MNVGEVDDAEAIERLGPIVEREVLPGDAQGIRFAKEGPAGAWDSGGDHAEGGAAGVGLDSAGSRHGRFHLEKRQRGGDW